MKGRSMDKSRGRSAAATSRNPDVLLERMEKIFSDGKWNGRPEVVFWRGRYYLTFRSASGHDSPDGRLRMLVSKGNEPRGWTLEELHKPPVGDASEGHMLVTSERMFAYVVLNTAGAPAQEENSTVVVHSEDGRHWSEPIEVYERGYSFWKPVTQGGAHYVAADIMTTDPRVELLTSKNGIEWQRVSTIMDGKFTEAAIVFLKDGRLVAFTRQGRIALSRPPYKQWETFNASDAGGPAWLSGPAAALIGDTVLLSGRGSPEEFPDDQFGDQRTALFTFDPEARQLYWKMNMLTLWNGEEAYPHFLALDNRRALMAWYSGHRYEPDVPKQSDLLLATLRVVEDSRE